MDNNKVSAAAPPKATSYDVLPEALLLTSMLEILRQFTSPQNFSLMDASVVCSIPSLTAFSIPRFQYAIDQIQCDLGWIDTQLGTAISPAFFNALKMLRITTRSLPVLLCSLLPA